MSEIAPDPIMRIALGFMAAKHLFVASEIGVFVRRGMPVAAASAASVIGPYVLSVAHNLELLENMRAHAASGARLLLVNLWMDPTRTEPPAAPLMSGEFLVMSGEGQAYAEEDSDAWLAQTGWRKLERRPLAGPASVIIAEAA